MQLDASNGAHIGAVEGGFGERRGGGQRDGGCGEENGFIFSDMSRSLVGGSYEHAMLLAEARINKCPTCPVVRRPAANARRGDHVPKGRAAVGAGARSFILARYKSGTCSPCSDPDRSASSRHEGLSCQDGSELGLKRRNGDHSEIDMFESLTSLTAEMVRRRRS